MFTVCRRDGADAGAYSFWMNTVRWIRSTTRDVEAEGYFNAGGRSACPLPLSNHFVEAEGVRAKATEAAAWKSITANATPSSSPTTSSHAGYAPIFRSIRIEASVIKICTTISASMRRSISTIRSSCRWNLNQDEDFPCAVQQDRITLFAKRWLRAHLSVEDGTHINVEDQQDR